MPNTHSLQFNGTSESVNATDHASLELGTAGTIEMWIKPTSGDGTLMTKSANAGNERGFAFTLKQSHPTEKIRFFSSSDGISFTAAYFNVTITNNVWTHLALVFDGTGSSCELFKNGSSAGTGSASSSIKSNAADLVVGYNSDFGDYFAGRIDDIRLWSDKRTSTEIADNYQLELAGSEGNLISYWKLNNSYVDDAGANDFSTSGTFDSDVPFGAPSGTQVIIM